MTDERDNYDPFQPKSFVQTARAELPKLDGWEQVGEAEARMVSEMAARNELSGGTPVVRAFEQRWREWIGTRYAVTVINGTAALYSAYFGLGVGPGDEVICPVNTWICSISPALMLGARPVFCDIEPDTLLMDAASLEKLITPKTACICAVHLWGNVCEMDAILRVAAAHGIPVIEDCSHAHGACYRGRMCGSLADAGCWSLQGSKPVSAGEGGVFVTNRTDVFERACLLGQVNRVTGIDLVTEVYQEHQPFGIGMKLRAHPLGIGIAEVQLDKLEGLNARRRAYIEEVEAGLADVPGMRPIRRHEGAERAGFYGFPAIYEAAPGGPGLQAFTEALRSAGVNAGMTPYPNLHMLPMFAHGFDLYTRDRGPLSAREGYKGYAPGAFPGALKAAEQAIFLPVLSEPVSGAAGMILETLRRVAKGV